MNPEAPDTPEKNDYEVNSNFHNGYPVWTVKKEQGSFKTVKTNITENFKKLSPDTYCNITEFAIHKVVDGKTGNSLATWSKYFSISNDGILTVLTSDFLMTNYLVYVHPFNSHIWAWDDLDEWPDLSPDHVADITVYERAI